MKKLVCIAVTIALVVLLAAGVLLWKSLQPKEPAKERNPLASAAFLNDGDEDVSAWFPCKENGCPDTGFLAVNGAVLSFGLESRDVTAVETLHVNLDWQTERITVLLPLPAQITRWEAGETPGAVLLGEQRRKTTPAVLGEGGCPYLQEFVFSVEGTPLPEALRFCLKNTDDTLQEPVYYELTIALDWAAELIYD